MNRERYRPDAIDVQVTTGDAAGRLDEAMAAYRHALRLSPGLPAARMGLDVILERARTPLPNEQLVALLLDAYADERTNWDAIGWGAGWCR
jgi:cytochrome c-type biogenesis protein CcmH/NrfG